MKAILTFWLVKKHEFRINKKSKWNSGVIRKHGTEQSAVAHGWVLYTKHLTNSYFSELHHGTQVRSLFESLPFSRNNIYKNLSIGPKCHGYKQKCICSTCLFNLTYIIDKLTRKFTSPFLYTRPCFFKQSELWCSLVSSKLGTLMDYYIYLVLWIPQLCDWVVYDLGLLAPPG